MAHIFISFSHKDQDFAEATRRKLIENHFEVWMDKDIPTGERWREIILNKIETCSAVVAIVSPRSMHSLWVMRELSYAEEFEKLIFPLLIEGDPSGPIEDLQHSKDLDELVHGLRRLTRLFIASGAEDEPFATKLANDLRGLGADLWQDDKNVTEQHGLASSQVMLLVVSPETMTSTEIKEQWQSFHTMGKRIIPLLVRPTGVATAVREEQPYVDFLNQDYHIAFAQLYGVLQSLGVHLSDHEQISIPPQPQLQLDGFEMIKEARQTVWISGITLDVFSKRPDVLASAVVNVAELKIRLLLIDPNVEVINAAGAWVGINRKLAAALPPNEKFEAWASRQHHALTEEGRWVGARLYKSLQTLTAEQDRAPGRIEIRTVPYRLGTGYYIIDPVTPDGMLTAYPYFYHLDPAKEAQPARYNTSPVFLSRRSCKESDLWWFDQYVKEFKDLWDDAVPFTWASVY